MTKKRTRNRRQNKQKKRIRTKKMKGGAYSESQIRQLENRGFSEDQIQELQEMNIPFDQVMNVINQIMNQGEYGFHGNSDDFAEEVMNQLRHNDTTFDSISHAEDDPHYMDVEGDNGSLHLSDLDVSQGSTPSGFTSEANDTFHTPEIPEFSLSTISSGDESTASEYGGRRNKRKTSRKGKKSKKTRKQRGGTCYGNGVGANSYDPNFSIYNTRDLELFPYRPK
jgi:hypothetical protein